MKLEHFYSYFYALKSIKKLNSKLEKDGWVVKNSLCLDYYNLYFLPVIKKIDGGFNCSGNKLITLQGSPQEVGGDFYCSNNKLTTLQGSPQEVGGHFCCNFNQLTTLKGAPKEVGGNFHCDYNELTTLQGSPQEVGDDFCCGNNPIKDYSELDKIKIGGRIIK